MPIPIFSVFPFCSGSINFLQQFLKKYMNLNVTKRPFGHFDVHVIKLSKSGKFMLCAFLKQHCICMLKTFDHQTNVFKSIYCFHILSYLPLLYLLYALFSHMYH